MQSKSCWDYKKWMCPQRLSSYLGHAHKKKQKEHKRFECHPKQPNRTWDTRPAWSTHCLPQH